MGAFTYEQPVAGQGAFYGRDTLIRSLVEGLYRRRSFLVCGGPRIGKSSTLLQMIAAVHARWAQRKGEQKIVPVLIDLAKLQGLAPRIFWAQVWETITTATRDPRVQGEGVAPPPLPAVDFKRTRDPVALLFESLAAAWKSLSGTAAWVEYGLVVDNGDLLTTRKMEPFAAPLLELVGKEADWAPVSLIVAAGRALRDQTLDHGSPYAFMRPLMLGVLEEAGAVALAKAGVEDADDDLIASLMISSGRHPWVLQRLLVELEQRGKEIGVEGAVDAAAMDCLQLFDEIWAEFDLERGITYRGAYAAPEHALMQLLTDLETGIEVKKAERELGIRPLKEYADFLLFAGVIERAMLGDFVQVRAAFDLWNVWYAERIMR